MVSIREKSVFNSGLECLIKPIVFFKSHTLHKICIKHAIKTKTKSRTRETPNLSTNADRSTDTN